MTNPAALPAATDDFTRLVNGYAELATDPGAASEPAVGLPSADDKPPTPEERASAKRAIYEEYLKGEGYKYKVDEDGDISLRREGRWLVLFASDDDSQHFRLGIPNLWECQSEAETDLALELVNELNKGYKVVRFVLVDGWVWATVEAYLDPLSAFRGTFDRYADLLCETTASFNRRMRQRISQVPPSGPAPTEQPEPLQDDRAGEDRT